MRIKTRIGARLCELGLSERQLANRVGVDGSSINRLKNGRTQPLVLRAIAIARALGTSVEALYSTGPS